MILGQSITEDSLFSLLWLVSKSFIAAFMQRKCEISTFYSSCWATFQLISPKHCTASIQFIGSLSLTRLYKYAACNRPHLHFGVTYISAHQPGVTCPTAVFFCCSALWFYLPSIFTEQCVISAVLNVGKMRSKWLNEDPRVAVKGKNQTHMNQSSGKKINSLLSLSSFHFHQKFPKKVFIEEVSNYLFSAHPFIFFGFL